MGARKIVEWPKYKKTGSPTEKRQRRTQHVMDRIFAELLSLTGSGNPKRATATLLRASKAEQERVEGGE
jgi:hypothetical protein